MHIHPNLDISSLCNISRRRTSGEKTSLPVARSSQDTSSTKGLRKNPSLNMVIYQDVMSMDWFKGKS